MNRLRKFFRWRRQSNVAKLAVIMLILSVYFLVNGSMQIMKYVRTVHAPCEYLLRLTDTITQNDINELLKTDGVLAASPQREYTISFDKEKNFSVTQLSSDYLFTRYGLTAEKGHFYLNDAAFREIAAEAFGNTVRLRYADESGKPYSADFILELSLSGEEPVILAAGTSASLYRDNSTICVLMKNRDLTGADVTRLERLGYSILHREDMIAAAHAQEVLLLTLKFHFTAMLLAACCCAALIKLSFARADADAAR
ncbi:MAG: hypothetical protein IJ766_08320 [Clostridia bacterium]|nr:hypothetical protein [Clostridia bacterium]